MTHGNQYYSIIMAVPWVVVRYHIAWWMDGEQQIVSEYDSMLCQ